MAAKPEFMDMSDDKKIGYLDGFRFGLGFFIAWLLGISLVSVVVMLALTLVR